MRLYRCESNRYTDGVHVQMCSYLVVKETPRGYWIDVGGYYPWGTNDNGKWPELKWVSAHSTKRFAHPTQEEAIEAFHCRKRRYITILRQRIADAQAAMAVAPVNYTHYENYSRFHFPDRGSRQEIKRCVLEGWWFDPASNEPFQADPLV